MALYGAGGLLVNPRQRGDPGRLVQAQRLRDIFHDRNVDVSFLGGRAPPPKMVAQHPDPCRRPGDVPAERSHPKSTVGQASVPADFLTSEPRNMRPQPPFAIRNLLFAICYSPGALSTAVASTFSHPRPPAFPLKFPISNLKPPPSSPN